MTATPPTVHTAADAPVDSDHARDGDFLLATGGDFLMATGRRRRQRTPICAKHTTRTPWRCPAVRGERDLKTSVGVISQGGLRQDGAVAPRAAASESLRKVVGACAFVVGCRGWPGSATYGGRRPWQVLMPFGIVLPLDRPAGKRSKLI